MRSYVGEAASSSLWGLGGQGRSSGKAVGRGSSGRGGSQPADFTPGKTISPRGLALGKGDNPQEGSVGRGLERQKRLAKVPQTSLWPKLLFPVGARGRGRGHANNTHTPHIFFPVALSRVRAPPPANPLTSERLHGMTFSSTSICSPFPHPPSPVTQGLRSVAASPL